MTLPYRAPLLSLFPYQEEAAKFAASRVHSLLAHSMGLGKSAAAIRAADLVQAARILIICPASVRHNWQRELERFSPLDRPCQVMLPGDRFQGKDVTVISYEGAVKFCADLKAVDWSVLILDECHMLAHRTSRRTKSVYGANSRSPGIAASAARVIRLSGTPMPSDASQIFTHLKSAGLTAQSYYDFLYHFTTGWNSDYGYVVQGHRNVEELKAILKPFMLRKTKEEVLKDLPPLFFQTITVSRSDAALLPEFHPLLPQLAQADQELQAALSSMDPASTLSMLERTASSVTSLRRYILMCKLPAIAEQIEENLTVGGVDKLIMFGIHRVGIDYMAERLKKFGVVTVHGGTEAKKRQENIDAFQNKPEIKVFLANITAGGVGINLQNCSEIVFLELPWTPSDVAQACGRAHRLGQKNPVRARIFSLYNSVDEQVQDTLLRKTRELAKIL